MVTVIERKTTMGTRIDNLKLTKVVDGDTVKVEIEGQQESLRLICIDTEESRSGSKPVTNAGKEASRFAKQYFSCNEEGFPQGDVRVDIEFDTSDPETICLRRHRGNYGRLLCYVHKGEENYNLRIVRDGWSPYFVKYGRSRLYHEEFMRAEADAQSLARMIWNPQTNAGGAGRDYAALVPWWHLRDSVVVDYRDRGLQAGVLSVRLDYADIEAAADNEDRITVLCDLQGGINRWPGDGALIFAGSPTHRFNLWIPDEASDSAQSILRLIEMRYAGFGRGYLYVSGTAELYRGTPQIVLTDPTQLSDLPPGD